MDHATLASIPLQIVPDPDDPDCAQVLVEAVVCGVETSFVLDTGARRSALAPSCLVDRLPRAGSEASGGVFGSVSSELVRVSELRLGRLTLAGAKLTAAQGARSVPGPDLRNILGMDLLGLGAWELRFSEEMLWIDPPPSETARYPLISDAAGHIHVEVEFDDVSAACVWDTGAGVTVVDAGFAQAHLELFTSLGMGTGTDSNLTTMETPLATLAGCQIGQIPFSPSKVAIVDLSSAFAAGDRPCDLILGYPILRQADWRINFPDREWSVTRR